MDKMTTSLEITYMSGSGATVAHNETRQYSVSTGGMGAVVVDEANEVMAFVHLLSSIALLQRLAQTLQIRHYASKDKLSK